MKTRLNKFAHKAALSMADALILACALFLMLLYAAPWVVQKTYGFLRTGSWPKTCCFYDEPISPEGEAFTRALYNTDLAFDELLLSESTAKRQAGSAKLVDDIITSMIYPDLWRGLPESGSKVLSNRALDRYFIMLVRFGGRRTSVILHVFDLWYYARAYERTWLEQVSSSYIGFRSLTPFDFLSDPLAPHGSNMSFFFAGKYYLEESRYFQAFLFLASWCPFDPCGTCQWYDELYRRKMLLRSVWGLGFRDGWFGVFFFILAFRWAAAYKVLCFHRVRDLP